MCRLLNGRIPYLINSSSNSSRVGAMLCTAPRTGQLAMAVPVSLVAVHTGSLQSPLPSLYCPPPPHSKLFASSISSLLPLPFQAYYLPHSKLITSPISSLLPPPFRAYCLPHSELVASPIPSLLPPSFPNIASHIPSLTGL